VKFIGLNMSPTTCHDLFWEIDSSGNNKIELDEFLSFFEKINDEKELKETLEAYGKKQEKAVYFYAAYCSIAVAVFFLALYLQQTVLAMIALGVIGIFFVIFVGAERWERFFKTLEMMFCVMNENRLRLYTGFILACSWRTCWCCSISR